MTIHFQDIRKNFVSNILKEIYMDRVYDPYFNGKSDLTVFDLGANIGLFSMYAWDFAKKIVSVEPSGQIFEYLEKNMLQKPKQTKTILLKAAIGAKNGEIDLYGSDTNLTMFSTHKVGIHADDSEKVEMIDMEELFKRSKTKKCDIMKIDIEGSEFEVLSSRGFSKVASKIDFIVGEIHAWTGRNPHQCVQSLEENGFRVEIVGNSPILFRAERIK